MKQWSPKVWLGGAIAFLLTMSAMAGPPIVNMQNRSYGNSVSANTCYDIENGFVCRYLDAWENYDVKGSFEYSEAAMATYRYTWDPEDGSWESGYRYLGCPIDEKAITVHKIGATLAATLDPEGLGCNSYGYLESWDPVNEYQSVPWSFPGPREVSGEWADPFSYMQSIAIHKDTYYDGWSETRSTGAQQCHHIWGDMMTRGGFSIGIRSYAFEGPEGQAWGGFSLNSCNEHNRQN